MFFRSCFLKLFLISGFVFASAASAQIYTADVSNSEWNTATGPFSCSLTHKIPVFGKAVFSQKAGGGELFYLESQGKVSFPAGQSTLETAPPVWRSELFPERLGEVVAIAGNQPISIASPQKIGPLVSQLSQGVNLMYSSQAVSGPSSGSSIVRVVLTAKNFAAAYKTYQQCVADLIPYTFEQVARTSINYTENPTGLTASNNAELGKVARYIQADPNVVGVFVDGHSDNSGTPESRDLLSKQVAEWVTAYFIGRGVVADKITTRWHGDKFLIANNKTDAGRAENRRVTVRLEDEAAHKEFMKKEEENRKLTEKAAVEKAAVEIKKAETNAGVTISSSASSSGKMSPEEISRMVEGLDIVK